MARGSKHGRNQGIVTFTSVETSTVLINDILYACKFYRRVSRGRCSRTTSLKSLRFRLDFELASLFAPGPVSALDFH